MEKFKYFLPLLLLVAPVLSFGTELKRLPVSSRITAVTVYPDRAVTTRSVSLNLKPGSYLIAFDALPALIQDDSVRVEGKGGGGMTIAGMEIKRLFPEQSGEKRIKELDAEINGQVQRVGALDARKAGLLSQKAFFESIRVAWGERISRELAIGRPTAAELHEAAGFVGVGVTSTEEQTFAIDTELKSIKEKIDSLRRQRDESTGSRRKETKSVEVLLNVADGGNVTLNLTAVTPRAGWAPSYDIRLAADTKTAELTFRAMVRQQTGEDWNNVDLTLSTARPATGGAPPEMVPWRISFIRPHPPIEVPRAYAPAPARMSKLMRANGDSLKQRETAHSEVAMAEEASAAFETAEIGTEQSSVSFHLPRPLDIPSDGTQHGSIVAVDQLPVNIEFLAIPKLSPYVFLKSEIVNQAAYMLLPGKVNTFSGNNYTGSFELKKVAAGEKFELFFGTDDQVTVKREELKQHKGAGLFGKNRVSYRYRVELANLRKAPVTLTLRDQLPLAGDEEIQVSLDEPSVKPDESGSDGRITWKTLLNAGEKKELSYGILVEYPKERLIDGL